MKGKILLVVGLGVGYVLGTRAGREKYDQMKAAAKKLWNDPRVQQQVDNVEEFVKEKAPEVSEFLADSAKKVFSKSTDSQQATAKPTASPAPATRKPATRKPAASKPTSPTTKK